MSAAAHQSELAILLQHLEELRPQLRRQVVVGAVQGGLILLPFLLLTCWILSPWWTFEAFSRWHRSGALGVFLTAVTPIAFFFWPLLRAMFGKHKPDAKLVNSGLVQRLRAGMLQNDTIFDHATVWEAKQLPGRRRDDSAGQAWRLVRYLHWYLLPPKTPVGVFQADLSPWYLSAVLVLTAIVMFCLAPGAGLMVATVVAGMRQGYFAKLLANCEQLIGLLGAALQSPAPHDAAGLDSAGTARSYNMALVLNEIGEELEQATSRQLGIVGGIILGWLLLYTPFMLYSNGARGWPLLIGPGLFAVGWLWLHHGSRAWRTTVRQRLSASGLAERIASDTLDPRDLFDQTPPFLRFALLAGRKKDWREGLRGELLTVAQNVEWFMRPRQNHVQPLFIVIAMAIFAVLSQLAMPSVLAHQAVAIWLKQHLGKSWLIMFLISYTPTLLGLSASSLFSCIRGTRQAIAAQEFVAYLRERMATA